MKLSIAQVKHVAKLANLPIDEADLQKYAAQLSGILDYVKQLEKVDTTNVEPTFNISPDVNIQAEDHVLQPLDQAEAIGNAPLSRHGFIITKGVFNE